MPSPNTDRATWLGDPHAEARSHYKGFMVRTRKNLLHIQAALQRGEDVHIVTQLVNSLLGVVVFPWERGVLQKIRSTTLEDLKADGWPLWTITADELGTSTLHDLVRSFRHSVAHGNVRFTSDSRNLQDVTVEVANFPKRDKNSLARRGPAWAASMRADHLFEFVLRLIHFIEQHTHPNAA